MFRLTTCVAFGLLLAWSLSPILAQEKKDTVNPHHLPGAGIADPAGKTGFFPNNSGGIDAIELATGKVVWSTKDANRPLLATANRLFAQHKAHVIVVDSKDGSTIVKSKAITWPDWVAVDPAYGRSFRSIARMEGNSLYLTWDARAFYAGGARPTPKIEQAARKEAMGVARLDVENGKIEMLDADKVNAGKFLPMPNPDVNPTVGGLTLEIVDTAKKNAKNLFQRTRTLKALNDSKAVVWEREIAAPVILPPLP